MVPRARTTLEGGRLATLEKAFIDKVQPPEKGCQAHWDETVKGYSFCSDAVQRLAPSGAGLCCEVSTYSCDSVLLLSLPGSQLGS